MVCCVGCWWPWANFNIIWNCYPDLNSIILILLKWVKVLWVLSFHHQANILNWSFIYFISMAFVVRRNFSDRKTWCAIRTLNNNSLLNFKLLFIHFCCCFWSFFYTSNKVVRLMPYDRTKNSLKNTEISANIYFHGCTGTYIGSLHAIYFRKRNKNSVHCLNGVDVEWFWRECGLNENRSRKINPKNQLNKRKITWIHRSMYMFHSFCKKILPFHYISHIRMPSLALHQKKKLENASEMQQ